MRLRRADRAFIGPLEQGALVKFRPDGDNMSRHDDMWECYAPLQFDDVGIVGLYHVAEDVYDVTWLRVGAKLHHVRSDLQKQEVPT